MVLIGFDRFLPSVETIESNQKHLITPFYPIPTFPRSPPCYYRSWYGLHIRVKPPNCVYNLVSYWYSIFVHCTLYLIYIYILSCCNTFVYAAHTRVHTHHKTMICPILLLSMLRFAYKGGCNDFLA